MLSFQIQKNSVEFLRLSCRYLAFRGDDPVLASFPTLEALLRALEASGGADPATRSRLICAVVTRHRAAPGRLGSAIVLHAFRGMLGRLSKGLVGVEREDADALVAWALVEALLRVRPTRDPARIAMYVRQETRRVLFAALARDARSREDRMADEQESAAEDEDDEADAEDDAWCEEPPRDPLALERALRRRAPDAFADPASRVPIEEVLDARAPAASRVCDDDLLRAHAVRGGLRRLTTCLLQDASVRQREQVYRQLLRRAQQLVARRK